MEFESVLLKNKINAVQMKVEIILLLNNAIIIKLENNIYKYIYIYIIIL